MNLSVIGLLSALLWTVVAGGVAWLLLTPVRRRSLTGLMTTLVLTGAAASMGAMWGGIHEMLVPEFHWKTMIALSAFAGAVTAVAAYAGSRMLSRDTATLRQAVADIGAGRVPSTDGRLLSAEIEQVRSQLRETATALSETRERERALETARRELVSWVSHDLRTPLAGLRAMTEALEDGVVDDPELYYKQISASVDRLNQMVEDLFDLSRIQTGGVSRELERTSLDDLVSDCIAALEPLAAASGVQLSGSVTGPAPVSGNGPELNRALTNLIANAIRHTRTSGQVFVQVGVTETGLGPGLGPRAEVLIRDECGGIPVEHLERVFDVGFRGEAARTPRTYGSAGAGLGLAITRGIVEAHAGTVEVQNTVDGRGCQFQVLLPVVPG